MLKLEGLKENEVASLREKFGENTLPIKEGTPWFFILLSQFKSPLIYILVFVVFISLFLSEYIDASLAGFVVLVNVLMGFYQEYNAARALSALKKILQPKTIVVRNGKRIEIGVKELVPGDIVILGSGDRIPADGKLIEGVNLLVNEAILTGEEEAVKKSLGKSNELLFMGTTVIAGRGVMEVQKIGPATKMGEIGQDIAKIKEAKTPLQKRLEVFTKNLAWIVLAICIFIFIIGILHQEDFWQILKISVVLSVAAIPQGLPIAITVILALGMRRILKKKGLVEKLLSIETLGSTSVICTDKTGTLTEGVMKVVKTDFVNEERSKLALILNNEQKTNLEISLWNFVEESKLNPAKILESAKRIYDEPFDSEKKYSMTINEINRKEVALIVGAPDIIVSFCSLSNQEKAVISKKIEKWATSGLRLLGVIYKEKGNLKEKSGFAWGGLVGILDPIRSGVKESIEVAKKAGIKIKIITGDYRRTAERVARDLGFNVTEENIIEGDELEVISEKNLRERIDNIILFTRVTPHQKLKIVTVLQEKGEIVAMTGDGVNDAPALKKSDIGMVVGSASDVAKEAGDLILLDNNFKTIVAACEEGRLIFSNIKKVVSYVLSNSFVEIVLIFGAMLLDFPTPLTVVQILWIHIICDGPPDIMLGFEPKEDKIMIEEAKNIKQDDILGRSMRFLIFAISITVGLLALWSFWYFWRKTGDLELARTITFATVATVSLVYIFAFKNLKKIIIKSENFFKNKYLFLGVAYGLLLVVGAIYIPGLNKALHTVPLEPIHWLLILGVGLIATLWVEIVKVISAKRRI